MSCGDGGPAARRNQRQTDGSAEGRDVPLPAKRYVEFWQTVASTGAWTLKHQRPVGAGQLPLYRFAFVLGERRHGFEWQGERGSGGEHDRLARYFLDTVSRWME